MCRTLNVELIDRDLLATYFLSLLITYNEPDTWGRCDRSSILSDCISLVLFRVSLWPRTRQTLKGQNGRESRMRKGPCYLITIATHAGTLRLLHDIKAEGVLFQLQTSEKNEVNKTYWKRRPVPSSRRETEARLLSWLCRCSSTDGSSCRRGVLEGSWDECC